MIRSLPLLALLSLLALACPPALAGSDPRWERVRAYRAAFDADAPPGAGARVRAGELLEIVGDPTAPKDVRMEAAAVVLTEKALRLDPDLALTGEGMDRPRAVFTRRVLARWWDDDELTRSLARTLCAGLWPGAGAPEERLPEVLRSALAEMRAAALAELAGRSLEPILRRRIEAHVRPKDAPFPDVLSWLRKDALEESFGELTLLLRERDPAVTFEEARSLFAARPRGPDSWRRASYGTGSFLVDPPPPPKPPRIPLPKPPTRDAWWAAASTAERLEFCWATIVETGLYEVQLEKVPCPACDGTGRQTRRLSGGILQEWLCVRCGGGGMRVGRDLRYR